MKSLQFAADGVFSRDAAVPTKKKFLKQDQNGILAQIFLLCGNLRLAFSANAIFSARFRPAVKCRTGNCRANGANASRCIPVAKWECTGSRPNSYTKVTCNGGGTVLCL